MLQYSTYIFSIVSLIYIYVYKTPVVWRQKEKYGLIKLKIRNLIKHLSGRGGRIGQTERELNFISSFFFPFEPSRPNYQTPWRKCTTTLAQHTNQQRTNLTSPPMLDFR